MEEVDNVGLRGECGRGGECEYVFEGVRVLGVFVIFEFLFFVYV